MCIFLLGYLFDSEKYGLNSIEWDLKVLIYLFVKRGRETIEGGRERKLPSLVELHRT
jgi:hypothetical protein